MIALAIMLAMLALEALAFLLEFIGALVAPQVAPLPERKVVVPPRSVTLRAGERYP